MTGYTWYAIYVGRGASPVPPAWHEQRAFPAYRGETCVEAAHGELDADRACFLARIAGCARGSVIYLDLVKGTTTDYVDGWIYVVELFGYRPGIRCSQAMLAAAAEVGIDPTEWLFKAREATFEPAEIFDEEDTQPWVQ